jgi:pimeloyl-ACP methyl ester carboxylesterase
MSEFTLSSGITLEYLDNGVDSQNAILLHHGTPGCALAWEEWVGHERDVRAIAVTRPGYGNSKRNAGRSVATDLHLQSEILNNFGVEKFVSIGWSGGGPHALNMTREPRCVAAFTLAGVGEFGREDLNFLEGMGPENHEEFGEAVKGEKEISAWMDINALPMKAVTGSQIIEAFGGLIGDADKKALTAEFAEEMAAAMRHSISVSYAGWIDDDLAFCQPFGFDIESIDKPVIIWQGDEDFMVPQAHGEWLHKHIPNSQLKFVPGHGHISLVKEYKNVIIEEAKSYLQ